MKAAGLFCIGYDSLHSKLQDLSEADMIVHYFEELDYEKVKHLISTPLGACAQDGAEIT